MNMIGAVWRIIKNNFFAGLLITVPMGVTFWVLATLWEWVDMPLRRLFVNPRIPMD